MKKFFCFVFFSLSLSLFSQVVMVSCIESEHAEKEGNDTTLYFENKLLDFSFNEGLIVTNLPCTKLSLEKWKKADVNSFVIESEPDYSIMLYFSYENQKKYNEFTRKNLLPCKTIYCKIFKKGVYSSLYEEQFILDEVKGAGIYRKLDFCIEKIKATIVKNVRGSL